MGLAQGRSIQVDCMFASDFGVTNKHIACCCCCCALLLLLLLLLLVLCCRCAWWRLAPALPSSSLTATSALPQPWLACRASRSRQKRRCSSATPSSSSSSLTAGAEQNWGADAGMCWLWCVGWWCPGRQAELPPMAGLPGLGVIVPKKAMMLSYATK